MIRIVVVGAYPESLLNFRGALLAALVGAGHEVVAMAAPARPEIVWRLRQLGVSFRPFPIRRNGISPVADLRTYCALRRAFADLQPDVVLAYTVKPIIWGGLALRGVERPRFSALVTGLGFSFQTGGIGRRLLRVIVRFLYRAALVRAATVVFQNPENRDVFVNRRIVPHSKTAVVAGSGVDLNRFQVAALPAPPITFLALGRLLGDKGFREYAAAARIVKERYPDVSFRLLGMTDPSPDAIPWSEVQSWQTAGWIQYLPETEDVRPALAACHVYVLPSYHEGMPRSVLEALAMGRPILTTDVPGCRDTVIPGENGYLVPKADVSALADRITWFIEHPASIRPMGRRSRQLAETRFDVHEVNAGLLAILWPYEGR